MIVRRLPKFVLFLLYAMYFCAGFALVFTLVNPYVEVINTEFVEKKPPSYFDVLAFVGDDVRIVDFGDLEAFKRKNPDYSFLVPNGKEKYFSDRLQGSGVAFKIEAIRISENEQFITLSSDDIVSVVTTTYVATNKDVFPRTFMMQNMRDTFYKVFPSTIGGLMTCLIFFVICRKYLVK